MEAKKVYAFFANDTKGVVGLVEYFSQKPTRVFGAKTRVDTFQIRLR